MQTASVFILLGLIAATEANNYWFRATRSWQNSRGSEWGSEEYSMVGSVSVVNGVQRDLGCITCDSNQDCTTTSTEGWAVSGDQFAEGAATLRINFDAWENDAGGRCSFDSHWWDGDDDLVQATCRVDMLANAADTTHTFTCTTGSNDASLTVEYRWWPAGPSPPSPPTPPTPPAGCPVPRVRKAWSLMPCAERDLYIKAVKEFKDKDQGAEYAKIVRMHLTASRYAHGTSGFLPWHRYYILGWENALRAMGGEFACITLPYWDWDRNAGTEAQSPVYDARYFGSQSLDASGCVTDGAAVGWVDNEGGCLRRSFGSWGFTGQAEMAAMITDFPHYREWRETLEGAPHAAPHVYTGGQMGTFSSPEDPLFMVHHCNVDRMWALWQDYHGYDEIAKSALTDQHYFVAGESRAPPGGLEYDATLPMTIDGTETMPLFAAPYTLRDMMHPLEMPGTAGENDFVYDDDLIGGLLGAAPLSGSWSHIRPASGLEPRRCPPAASTERQVDVLAKRKQPAGRCGFDDHIIRELCEMKTAAQPEISNRQLFNYLAKLECDLVDKPASSPRWVQMMVPAVSSIKYQQPCWFVREQ